VIIPTILTKDLADLKEKITVLKEGTDRFQIDIIDGQFAENKTITVEDLFGLKEIEPCLLLDLHLMVKEPVVYLEKDLPGTVDLVSGHIEAMPSQIEFCRQAKEQGFSAGLAVDWDTPVNKLEKMALDMVDQVLILGVKAGYGGQKINPAVLVKIKELAQWRDKEGWDFKIGVDGGVDEISLAFCKKMGADVFYIGSAIWQADDPMKKLRELRQLIKNKE